MTNFKALLETLARGGVEFIVIGGAAAVAHGSIRLTRDLDVVYRRTGGNVERVAAALAGSHPYLRGAPPGLPFSFDAATIRRGLNFTLDTDLGQIDFLGEVAGGGTYEQLLPHSEKKLIYNVECYCVSLARLILLKRAAGRPKDLEAIAELEALLEEKNRAENSQA